MDDKIIGFKINSQGFGTIPKLVMQDRSLNIIAKVIYAYLCSFTGAGDSCFPSRDKVCYDLNINKDTFTKYRNELISKGYIKVEMQRDESRKFLHNVYILCDTVQPRPTSPCPTSPDTVTPDMVKPDTINNNIKSNNIKSNSNNNSHARSPRERKPFVPPTVEEVAAYCRERGNTVDPETFVDFYTGKGWMVGKNKMADWKAAVRTWERNRSAESKFRESPPRDAFLEFLDEEAAKARG